MARKAAKNVRGTERYRDERRRGGPRLHGREWHEHDEPHDLERVLDNEGNEAAPEVESSGERYGVRRSRTKTKAKPKGPRRI